MDVIERVKGLIANYLDKDGLELIDIMYRREQGGMMLRLLVDTPAGVTIAECEALNKYLSETLDIENVIDERYTIEVSSPGLDRPLKTERDFARVVGQALEVNAYGPIDGKKYQEGTLIGVNKEEIVLEKEGISVVIPREKIALARLKIEVS